MQLFKEFFWLVFISRHVDSPLFGETSLPRVATTATSPPSSRNSFAHLLQMYIRSARQCTFGGCGGMLCNDLGAGGQRPSTPSAKSPLPPPNRVGCSHPPQPVRRRFALQPLDARQPAPRHPCRRRRPVVVERGGGRLRHGRAGLGHVSGGEGRPSPRPPYSNTRCASAVIGRVRIPAMIAFRCLRSQTSRSMATLV